MCGIIWIERAGNTKGDGIGHQVLVIGFIDVGCGRHQVSQVATQVTFIIVHRHVGQRVAVTIGIVATVVRF